MSLFLKSDAYSNSKHLNDVVEVSCIMLATMSSKLQKEHDSMDVFNLIKQLKTPYQEQAKHGRFDVSKSLFQTKLTEGSLVGPFVLKMIGYVENLKRLGYPLSGNLLLQSFPESFSHFVMNFLMNDMEKSLPQLAAMLRFNYSW